MPADPAKKRQRKVEKVIEQWAPQEQWRKFKPCTLCGGLFCVNNYEDRRSRTPKVFGRPICPWCSSRKGKLRMAEHILVERVADLPCLNNWEGDPFDDDPSCKCVRCVANRIVISQRRKEIREDPSRR